MSKEVNAELTVPGVAPEALWPLLSTGAGLEQWLAEHASANLAAGELRCWGRYTPDTPGPQSNVFALTEWRAPDGQAGGRLAFDWELRGQATQVRIELEPDNDGSRVSVRHTALGERLNRKGALHDFWYTALENLRLAAVTGRPQQFVEYGPQPGGSLALEVEIAAAPEAVFRCLIEPEWMAKLWNDEQIRVEPVVGGVYDYGWQEGGPRRILALDPPRLLSFSWLYPPETEESVVTWRLEDMGAGRTRLSLTHEELPSAEDHEEYRAGWFSFLAIIKGISELGPRWSKVVMRGSAHGEA